ncbi:MAG: arsenate reductase ArsC [Phycisphaerales bacterium]
MKKQNVLFLCTANSARSQMAEALLRHKAGDRFDVFSAGLEPGSVNPFAIRVVGELGIGMEGQWSKGVKEYLGRLPVRYLITVCDGAAKRCPAIWPGAQERMHWSIDDPAPGSGETYSDEEKLARFRKARDELNARLDAWLKTLPLPAR